MLAVNTSVKGELPYLGAVLLAGGAFEYTHCAVPGEALKSLLDRSDQQIVALEMWAVLLALETFAERLRGAYVKVWIDNRAGEAILRRGSAACEDHNLIAHCIWTAAYVLM